MQVPGKSTYERFSIQSPGSLTAEALLLVQTWALKRNPYSCGTVRLSACAAEKDVALPPGVLMLDGLGCWGRPEDHVGGV